MSFESVPHEVRHRRSDETLSTIDNFPAPPYGLEDAAFRPGSIRNFTVRSDNRRSSQMKYGLRVGKLEIRCSDAWQHFATDFEILEFVPIDQHLSHQMRAVLESLERVIKLGHSVLQPLETFMVKDPSAENSGIALLYERIRSVWEICMTMGAALCESEGDKPISEIKWVPGRLELVCKTLFETTIEKLQRIGLTERNGATHGHATLPAPTAQQREKVNRFATQVNQLYGWNADALVRDWMYVLFRLKLKTL